MGCILCLDQTPDGKTLVSGGTDKIVRVWDLKTGKVTARFRGHSGEIGFLRIASHGNWVASAAEGAEVFKVWKTTSGEQLEVLKGHTGKISGLDITPEASFFVSVGSTESEIRVWNAVEQKQLEPIPGPPFARPMGGPDVTYFGVSFLHDGRSIATLGGDSNLRIYPSEKDQQIKTIKLPYAGYRMISSPDGEVLALGLESGRLAIVRIPAR